MNLLLGLFITISVIAIGALVYYFSMKSPNAQADDGSPMSVVSRRILVWYLLLFGSCLVYMLVSVNFVDFPEPALLPEAVQTAPQQATQGGAGQTTPPSAAGQTSNGGAAGSEGLPVVQR